MYSPYLITEKALDFIDRNASKSFFLYFTPTLPHAELIVPKESLQEFDGKFDEVPFYGNRYAAQAKPRAAYAAMVSCLDHAVGKIVGKLKEKNILENTIIIFLRITAYIKREDMIRSISIAMAFFVESNVICTKGEYILLLLCSGKM